MPRTLGKTTSSRSFKFGYALACSPAPVLILWLKPRGLDKFSEMLGPKIIKDYYTFVGETVRQRVAIDQQREAEKQLVQREDMFHFLYHAKDPDTGKPAFDFRNLLAEANLLILAGSDTTAITISGLFFLSHTQ